MPDKKKQYAYQNAWIASQYERINLTVPKGAKAEWQAAADQAGMSLTAYIRQAVEAAIADQAAADPGEDPKE